eukprot:14150408-Alexandrium_andersonii.AAC.1
MSCPVNGSPDASSYGVLAAPSAPAERPRPDRERFLRNAAHGAASDQKHAGRPACLRSARVISST